MAESLTVAQMRANKSAMNTQATAARGDLCGHGGGCFLQCANLPAREGRQ